MSLIKVKQKDIKILSQKKTLEKIENAIIYPKFYIESYGCQMNFSDSEIITSILLENKFSMTNKLEEADLILINTCSIREKAEQTIRTRLQQFNILKNKKSSIMIGLLGCMAERLKIKILEEEKLIDFVVGPDAYRDLPNLIESVKNGRRAINVILSKDETYADISPVRLSGNGVTAFVTITRGCDNMCTFCIVPFTRGRERSRDPNTILAECKNLWDNGYKEVTLLGQNVDSYFWYGGGLKKDFYKISNTNIKKLIIVDFSQLLELVAKTLPGMRIRFSTSNPYDMSEKVLNVIKKYNNICKYIHLPVQSGSTNVLRNMNRKHTREEYCTLIDKIREIIPECTISYDIIVGFCGETEQDHEDTISLMNYVKYDFGYMFSYSMRPGTIAGKKLIDNVPKEIKKKRLQEIIKLQREHSYNRMQRYLGKIENVLIEGTSKKDINHWYGRNSQNTVVVFPKGEYKIGDFVDVKIHHCTSATLIGESIT